MSNLNCPNCAGKIEGISPLIRSIDCSYCGAWLRLNNQTWEANTGQEVALNAPSFLHVGLLGNLSTGEQYKVMGRIRFQYERDTWDEWWLEDSYGKGFWLEEDDGVYYRHNKKFALEVDDTATNAGVADELSLSNGMKLFITEKFEATVVGREGFLPSDSETNSSVTYIDGVVNGLKHSLEIDNNYASISKAEVFNMKSIHWESA